MKKTKINNSVYIEKIENLHIEIPKKCWKDSIDELKTLSFFKDNIEATKGIKKYNNIVTLNEKLNAKAKQKEIEKEKQIEKQVLKSFKKDISKHWKNILKSNEPDIQAILHHRKSI